MYKKFLMLILICSVILWPNNTSYAREMNTTTDLKVNISKNITPFRTYENTEYQDLPLKDKPLKSSKSYLPKTNISYSMLEIILGCLFVFGAIIINKRYKGEK